MAGLVVVTHGTLAAELVEAVRTIVGLVDHLDAVSIGWKVDVEDARRKIGAGVDRVSAAGAVVVLTDMFGGTPSNLALSLLEPGRIEVVTGVNLPMLIKLARPGPRELDLQTMARELRETGRNAIWVASELLKGQQP